jgi:hypothetical protein
MEIHTLILNQDIIHSGNTVAFAGEVLTGALAAALLSLGITRVPTVVGPLDLELEGD